MPGEGGAAFGVTAPDAHLTKPANNRDGCDLRFRLIPAADHSENTGVLTGERARGDSTGGAGSNLAEIVGLNGGERPAVARAIEQELEVGAALRIRGVDLDPEVLGVSRGHVMEDGAG